MQGENPISLEGLNFGENAAPSSKPASLLLTSVHLSGALVNLPTAWASALGVRSLSVLEGSTLLEKHSGDRAGMMTGPRKETGKPHHLPPTPTCRTGCTCRARGTCPLSSELATCSLSLLSLSLKKKNPSQGFVSLPPSLNTLPAASNASPLKTLSP